MKHLHKFLRIIMVILVLSMVVSLFPTASAADREAQLSQKINQIVAGIPSSATSDAEKALYLHDYVVKNVTYKKEGDHQTAAGALLDGKAVCAGYADAYLRLLTAVGIEAHTITGDAINAAGQRESHAWTMVVIDGKCLFTDVTWDDPFINGKQDPNYISYEFFNITLEQMNKDHFPDAESKKLLPAKCNHTGYDFYTTKQGTGTGYGIFGSNTTAREAAKYFRYLGVVDGADAFICEFRFDGDGAAWVSENWVEVAKAIGLSGSLSVSCMHGGSVITMTVSGTLDKTVPVASVSLDKSNLTLNAAGASTQLTATVAPSNATNKGVYFFSSNPSVATVSESGLVTAVSNGTATITVRTNDGGKTATCGVTVSIPQPEQPKPTDPTEPATQPSTQPTTPPTEPSTQPTTPPTEPSTQPTTPPTEPSTQPTTEPTEPTSQPSAPTEPTMPPTQPETVPNHTDPQDSVSPTAPDTLPSEPVETTDPTVIPDTTEPTDPTDPGEPSDPVVPTESTEPEHTATEQPLATDAQPDPTTVPSSPSQTTEKDKGSGAPYIAIGAIICGVIAVIIVIIAKKRK